VVIFREARRADVPAIVALLADDVLGAERESGIVDEAYLVAFDQIAADPGSRLIVAEADGQVAGTLQLNLLPGLSRHGMLRAQIEGVRVAAAQRGHGLGKAMIEWAIGQAREHGCGLVQLTSDKRRPDAIRFYESLGFAASHEGFKLSLLSPADSGVEAGAGLVDDLLEDLRVIEGAGQHDGALDGGDRLDGGQARRLLAGADGVQRGGK
jgi:GNAT superfamily N-acetyltransferase